MVDCTNTECNQSSTPCSFINRGHEAFSTEPVKNAHNVSGRKGSAPAAASGAAAMGAGVPSQLNFYYIQNVTTLTPMLFKK